MPRCQWCNREYPNKNLLNKHESVCEWKERKLVWEKRLSDNEGKTFWYVDTERYILKKCVLSPHYEMLKWIEEDGKLSSWSSGFREENLCSSEPDAQIRLDYLHKLYFDTFKYKPYLKEKLLVEHLEELRCIEKTIAEKLKDYPNFLGVDFCDVSARGIQIRGHHSQIKSYTYGSQPTIEYDFSNYPNIIGEFVSMWEQCDTPERIKNELSFIADGEKYGWD